MSDPENSEEINAIDLLETIWKGKFIIAAASILCLTGVVVAIKLGPPPSYIAKTEIGTISASSAERYTLSNSVGFFRVLADEISESEEEREESAIYADNLPERENSLRKLGTPGKAAYSVTLLESFVEILVKGNVLIESLKKFGLLNRDDFDSDEHYNVAIAKMAASIKIHPPQDTSGKGTGMLNREWTIEFKHSDEQQWLDALNYAANLVNEELRKTLNKKFKSLIQAASLNKSFEIEDLSVARANLIFAHKQELSARIKFLNEQGAIARELGIAKHSGNDLMESRSPTDQRDRNNFKMIGPVYTRGYQSIEKEIELIRSRDDVEPFVNGLLEIDRRINAIKTDKTLDRAENFFALTPIATGKGFTGASVSVAVTDFEYKSGKMMTLILAFFLGGTLGAIYVIMANSIRRRRR